MNYKVSGVDSIIIYLGDTITQNTSDKILSIYQNIKEKNIEGIIEIVPSYTSIYIQFDILKYKHKTLFNIVKNIFKYIKIQEQKIAKAIEIPVFYGKEVGFDLERVAKENSIEIDELIANHSSKIYRVYTIGFAPGFAYMGEVDKKIQTPRLETPRELIPKGSVALADVQTAVYPKNSPGGWNIIGRTYIDMFDKTLEGFSYLNIGDSVKFVPISKDEFIKNGGIL